MRIFGGVFMGIIFLTVGIILLLNTFFNFNINVFKLTIGIVIVLFGIFVLFNGFGFHIAETLSLEKESLEFQKFKMNIILYFLQERSIYQK